MPAAGLYKNDKVTITVVNYPSPKGNGLLRALRLCLRSLIFEFPPDNSGNPYSYRRVHFAPTV